MTIPPKFIDGCQGDLVEARRRWDITRTWREVGQSMISQMLMNRGGL